MGVCGCVNPRPGGCHACNPGGDYPIAPPNYSLPPAPAFHPPGCICPPTSEQTCQAPMCPRKGLRYGVGAGNDINRPQTR